MSRKSIDSVDFAEYAKFPSLPPEKSFGQFCRHWIIRKHFRRQNLARLNLKTCGIIGHCFRCQAYDGTLSAKPKTASRNCFQASQV
jgi:hypothetical protein